MFKLNNPTSYIKLISRHIFTSKFSKHFFMHNFISKHRSDFASAKLQRAIERVWRQDSPWSLFCVTLSCLFSVYYNVELYRIVSIKRCCVKDSSSQLGLITLVPVHGFYFMLPKQWHKDAVYTLEKHSFTDCKWICYVKTSFVLEIFMWCRNGNSKFFV